MSGEPADRAYTLYVDVGEVAGDTLLRCGICGCLVVRQDREFHRRWHNREPTDRGTNHGGGFGANEFVVVLYDDGYWDARSTASSDSAVGDSPSEALRTLIEKLAGWTVE